MSKFTVIESDTMMVLFSYSTCVAYFDKVNKEVYKTDTYHSNTTSKHLTKFFNEKIVGKYLSAFNPKVVPQALLDKKFPITVNQA